MRSIFVYYKNLSPQDLLAATTRLYGKADQVGYDFELSDHIGRWGLGYVCERIADFEPEDWANIGRMLGDGPSAVLVVDVTGTRSCDVESARFVSEAFGFGVSLAQDDYSEFLWAPEDIFNVNREGRKFFTL